MLHRFVFFISVSLLFATSGFASQVGGGGDSLDIALGEARFSAVQKEWFEAIARLDKELSLHKAAKSGEGSSASRLFNQAEISLIDYELSYRLYQRDGLAIRDLIESNSDEKIRNSQLFKLAQGYFYKEQIENSRKTLKRIKGEVAADISNDLTFFRAQLLMSGGLYNEAVSLLEELNKEQGLLAFAGINDQQGLFALGGYNLGIANLSRGNAASGLLQLDLVGRLNGDDETTQSVRDRANLLHGEQLLNNKEYELAGLILDRVRLQGPFSSRALLTSGWVAALQDNFEQALVPWTLLSERRTTDDAVQEALLAVPYCYSKLGVYTKAATLYGRAVEVFGEEVKILNDSIVSIQDGYFLNALAREESKHDPSWVVKLGDLPGMPETDYLLDLMASIGFQDSLNNYLDLRRIHKRLNRWQQDLLAFEELIKMRRSFYEPLLPGIDKKTRRLDRKINRVNKKRRKIGEYLLSLQKEPRPDLLASRTERRDLERIDEVDKLLQPYHVVKSRARIERLRGLVYWSIYSNYDQRVKVIEAKVRKVDEIVDALEDQREMFALKRRAASESYGGYDELIGTLRARIKEVMAQTTAAMTEQGDMLAAMMETELVEQREKLKEMQVKAQFAMAENYDRAATRRSSGR